MIRATLFKPESKFARTNAPLPGLACLQVVITMPNEQCYVDHHWLKPGELHCVFDVRWLHEHLSIHWKKLMESAMPAEVIVIERCSPERVEIEKFLRSRYEDRNDSTEEPAS